MQIDWQSLQRGMLPLDYYAVTVRGGKIAAQKAYYAAAATAASGFEPFVSLTGAGFLRPFSFGIDDAGNEKFDFELIKGFRAVCMSVAERHAFFDLQTAYALDGALQRLGATRGKILGMKADGAGVKSVCLYFRTNMPCTGGNVEKTVRAAVALTGVKEPSCRFPQGDGVQLCLVALDFSRAWRKVKFYFKFKDKTASRQIAACLQGSALSAAEEILRSDGFAEGFQVALSGAEEIFNLYLRPPAGAQGVLSRS